ncbi:winged helix-turn-helix domain-containing protein [Knoellia locipacati]|uniref:nSTAND1 domain-containing NTPase n=1 Tax=Knoellia locipacati TaxID=882824 RepID=UPI00384DCDB6
MEFRLLGPLAVSVDGRPLPLGGPKQRAVLALLALHAGEVVSVERLIDTVWAGEPPGTARNTLQTYVRHLRRIVGGDRIQYRSPGYVLVVAEDEVDVTRFTALLGRGRSLMATDRRAGVEALQEALALWRGPALEDLSGITALHPEITHLESLRLVALEERIAGELALGQHGALVPELELLVATHPLRERLVALHMAALYGSGRQAEALSAFRSSAQVLRDELGIAPSPDLQHLHQSILEQDEALFVDNHVPVVLARNPYKGLRPFHESDSDHFFGRERAVERIISRLAEGTRSSRFLAVVGPSGSGKSSVVAAGLVPALRAGGLPGSAGWVIATMRPGFSPVDELAAALREQCPNLPEDVRESLDTDHGLEAAAHAVRTAHPGAEAELMVVVDQFEELFTLVADDDERDRFLRSVVAATRSPTGRVRVVVTLRADFYDRPLAHAGFGDLVASRTEALLPLTVEELERAVVAPLDRVGVRLDPHLLTEIVLEFSSQPSALPLLQYALTETFENRDDDTLTLRAYRHLGGLAGTLARAADEAYGRLDRTARDVARQLFLRLVNLGTDGKDDSRRRVLHSELDALGLDRGQLDATIEVFGSRRLLTFDRDASTGEPTVEVAHEALLQEWGRLRGWLEAARDDVQLERRLGTASAEWVESDRDPSALIQGERLIRLEGWMAASAIAFTEDERAFVEASLAHRAALADAEAARLEREAADELRSKSRLQGAVALFAILSLIAATLAGLALTQQRRSQLEARIAAGRELAAAAVANLDVDPERSILLALEAVRRTRGVDESFTREAREALHRALWRSRLVLTVPGSGRAAMSRDATLLATPVAGGATVWSMETGAPIRTLAGHVGGVNDVAFAPTGSVLATAGEDGIVRLWDAARDSPPSIFRLSASADRLAFSPAGDRLAITDAAHTVHVWNTRTGREERTLTAPPGVQPTIDDPHGIAFSPDGRFLVGAPGALRAVVWDLETGGLVQTLTGHEWEIADVAFAPDGDHVATASIDGTAKIWEARTGRVLMTLADHKGDVVSVAYSPDGGRVATGATDGGVRVWDVTTGMLLQNLVGHQGAVGSVAFNGDGSRLLSAGSKATRLWDLSVGGAREWVTVPASARHYGGLAFAPDGATFAVAGPRSGATIHDAATGASRHVLAGIQLTVNQLAFSPDGRRVVGTAGSGANQDAANRVVPVWDTATGALLLTLKGHTADVSNAVFSPDGTRLVTSSADGTVRLWDTATGSVLRSHDIGADAWALAFSPDGTTVVAGPDSNGAMSVLESAGLTRRSGIGPHEEALVDLAFIDDRTVVSVGSDSTGRVWDVDSGRELRSLRGHNGAVLGVAVSPDRGTIATGSADGTAKLWDARTGLELLTLVGHTKTVYAVRFSPDGRFLATASIDGTVALHPLRIDELADLAASRVTRSLTDDECRQYLHVTAC